MHLHVLTGHWDNIMFMVQNTTAKEIVSVNRVNKLDIVQKYKYKNACFLLYLIFFFVSDEELVEGQKV